MAVDGFFARLCAWLAESRETRFAWYVVLALAVLVNGYMSVNLFLLAGGLALIVEGFALVTAGLAGRK